MEAGSQAEESALAIALRAEPTYRLGEPIVLGVEIENRGSRPVRFLQWGTPLEEAFTADYLTVERDGEVLPYDGKLVKRTDPGVNDYRTIGPGEKLETTVEVSAAYPVEAPGDYTVAADVRVFDAFTPAEGEAAIARSRDEHRPLRVSGPEVSFTVEPGEEPLPTAGQRVRREQPKREAPTRLAEGEEEAPTPNLIGGTPEQQEETRNAHTNAITYAALAESELRERNLDSLYETWFGVYDQTRYETVTQHYAEIGTTLTTEAVTYNLTGEGCEPGVYAYTYWFSRTVWLCDAYMNAPETGTDSKFGTLVHEWSHAVCQTSDLAYGQAACMALAESEPEKAIENADSHEYFVEAL
jgi:hypothetical protein